MEPSVGRKAFGEKAFQRRIAGGIDSPTVNIQMEKKAPRLEPGDLFGNRRRIGAEGGNNVIQAEIGQGNGGKNPDGQGVAEPPQGIGQFLGRPFRQQDDLFGPPG